MVCIVPYTYVTFHCYLYIVLHLGTTCFKNKPFSPRQ
ncbi:unnamed protein product [Acanthoscelides obtectus]|uniref:Uncharacterized protein n=1 Tax=Acanthoscelides obtectus TaxID=200917 RepID=A0A9P0MB77_ACAOB|nr:unnamed protein product [Acanthoscelides obtectus]CAK1666787.1 hypothetical protein AOBTE_LOCUS25493 [Acanthoscelides obtectus]